MLNMSFHEIFLCVIGVTVIGLGGVIVINQTNTFELLLGYGIGICGVILLFLVTTFAKPDDKIVQESSKE